MKSEIEWAKKQVHDFPKPVIAISTKSKESVKNWPVENWSETIDCLSRKYTIIQLGDSTEPEFNDLERYAGKLNMRESASILSRCQLFVGPDSLLMHVANGLDLKSVIIFGNARPVNCLGYPENVNLTGTSDSRGSWFHDGYGSVEEDLEATSEISPKQVLQEIDKLLSN